MYYGDEKIRQMIRSLLPSTSRTSARNNKRAVKQAFRRKNKSKLRQVQWDDAVCFENDGREMRGVVRDRRNADKVGPFINWVKARTLDMRQEDRKSYVKGLVPNNTIGQHAMTHLPREGFDHPNVDYVQSLPPLKRKYFYNFKTKKMELRPPEKRILSYDEYRKLIVKVLEFGMHAALNKSIEHTTATKVVGHKVIPRPEGGFDSFPIVEAVGPTRARLLLGWHDIDPFLRDLFRGYGDGYDYRKGDGSYHPEWRKSLDVFLARNRETLSR